MCGPRSVLAGSGSLKTKKKTMFRMVPKEGPQTKDKHSQTLCCLGLLLLFEFAFVVYWFVFSLSASLLGVSIDVVEKHCVLFVC